MFPNLMGQKAVKNLTAEEMGEIAGISRNAYDTKMKNGRFTAEECKAYCDFFGLSFDFLFATDAEIQQEYTRRAVQEDVTA